MCYSVNTSILSYSIGMMSAIVCLYNRQYIIGMIILCYCQVQLGEALIWRGIDTDNEQLNRLGTLYIKYTLPAHLLAVGMGVWLTNGDYKTMIAGLIFYLGVVGYYKYSESENSKNTSFPDNRECMKRECQNNDNRLKWPFPDAWYMIQTAILFIVLFLYLSRVNAIVSCSFFTITYVMSRLMYKWTASSMWCFMSAFLAPILVFATRL
jgi:hypothetical protein